MALFGYFVIARSGRAVGDLSCVQRVCQEASRESVRAPCAGTLCGTLHDGDWQYSQILNGWGLDRDAIAAALDRYVGPFGEGVDAFVTAMGFRFE